MNEQPSSGLGRIIWRNVSSPIFIIILALVIALLVLGAFADALFLFSVIFFNTVIATAQELRAKWQVNKLALLNAHGVRKLLADDTVAEVPLAAIAAGDNIIVRAGDQMPVDGTVVQGRNVEVNEALLTGEAKLQARGIGDTVYAGSLVVTGEATVAVTLVGPASRVGQMNATLKTTITRLTPLQQSLNRTIGLLTVLAVVLIVIIFVNGHIEQTPLAELVITAVTGAISLVPEGLLLASSLLLAYAAVQMTQSRILAQRLAAIEGFGRLRYLCVDKTGTLTSPAMVYEQMIVIEAVPDLIEADLARLVGHDASPTMAAIGRGLKLPQVEEEPERISFSSERKYSAVRYRHLGRMRTVALGAPEILAAGSLPAAIEQQLAQFTQTGRRVLLLAAYPNTPNLYQAVAGPAQALALVVLRQDLRPGVKAAVAHLQHTGVAVRVISGDNLATVQAIAAEVGITGSQRGITGSELARLNPRQWSEAVAATVVFARVTPEQKQRLIKSFHELGYTGMVGDGINDALALREADLGIAMAEGSQAARDVADVVLLGNSFVALPKAMALASAFILRLEMVATLFFNRIVASLVILLVTLVVGTDFAYLPRQITLMNWLVVGLPIVFWSLQPIVVTRHSNPAMFFRRTLSFAVPNGLLSGLAIVSTYLWVLGGGPDSPALLAEARTLAIAMTVILGLAAFLLSPRALGIAAPGLVWRQLGLSVVALVAVGVSAAGGQFSRHFFGLVGLHWRYVAVAAVIAAGVITLQAMIARRQSLPL